MAQIPTGRQYLPGLAIKSDGSLWAWGDNGYGQLGDSSYFDRYYPAQVGTATDWKSISCGWYYSIDIKTDGTIWVWGVTYQNYPVQVDTATNWKEVSAGWFAIMAIKTDGTLWAWGDNTYGQFGTTMPASSAVPVQVGIDNDWAHVASGAFMSAAIKANGSLWTWGGNTFGELGDSTTSPRSTPIPLSSAIGWKKVSSGKEYNLAIKADGTLWAWGRNNQGQLGNNTQINQYYPVQIGSDANWTEVSASEYETSMAVKTDGSLWAWGYNFFGQIGDSTQIRKFVPTQVFPACMNSATTNISTVSNFEVFPNPGQGLFNVSITLESAQSVDLQVFDLQGQLLNVQHSMGQSNLFTIDLSDKPTGLYIIRLITERGTATRSVVKR